MSDSNRLCVSAGGGSAVAMRSLVRGNSVATLNQIYEHQNSIPVRNRILNTAKSLQHPSIDLPDNATMINRYQQQPVQYHTNHQQAAENRLSVSPSKQHPQQPPQSASAHQSRYHVNNQDMHNSTTRLEQIHHQQQQQQAQMQPTSGQAAGQIRSNAAHKQRPLSGSAAISQTVKIINIARRHKRQSSGSYEGSPVTGQQMTRRQQQQHQPHQRPPAGWRAPATLGASGPSVSSADKSSSWTMSGCRSSSCSSVSSAGGDSSLELDGEMQAAAAVAITKAGALRTTQSASHSRSPSPAPAPATAARGNQNSFYEIPPSLSPAPPARRRVLPSIQQPAGVGGQECNSSQEQAAPKPIQSQSSNLKRHRKLPQIPTNKHASSRQSGHGSMAMPQQAMQPRLPSPSRQLPSVSQRYASVSPNSVASQQTGSNRSQPVTQNNLSLSSSSLSNNSPASLGNSSATASSKSPSSQAQAAQVNHSSSNSNNNNRYFTFEIKQQQQMQQLLAPSDHLVICHTPGGTRNNLAQSPSPAAASRSANNSPNHQRRLPAPHVAGEQNNLTAATNSSQLSPPPSSLTAGRGRRLSTCGSGSRASFLMSKQHAISEFSAHPFEFSSSASRGSTDWTAATTTPATLPFDAQGNRSSSASLQQQQPQPQHQNIRAASNSGSSLMGAGVVTAAQQPSSALVNPSPMASNSFESASVCVQPASQQIQPQFRQQPTQVHQLHGNIPLHHLMTNSIYPDAEAPVRGPVSTAAAMVQQQQLYGSQTPLRRPRGSSGAIAGLPPRAASATETSSGEQATAGSAAGLMIKLNPATRSMLAVGADAQLQYQLRPMAAQMPLMSHHQPAVSRQQPLHCSPAGRRLGAPPLAPGGIQSAISVDVYHCSDEERENQHLQQQHQHHSNSGSTQLGAHSSPQHLRALSPSGHQLLQSQPQHQRSSLVLPMRERHPSNVSTNSMPAGAGFTQASLINQAAGAASAHSKEPAELVADGKPRLGAWVERFANAAAASGASDRWHRSASQIGSSAPGSRLNMNRSSSGNCTSTSSSTSRRDSSSSSESFGDRSSLRGSSLSSSSGGRSSSSDTSGSGWAARADNRRQSRRQLPPKEDKLTLDDRLKLAERSASKLFRKVELSPQRRLSSSKQNSAESGHSGPAGNTSSAANRYRYSNYLAADELAHANCPTDDSGDQNISSASAGRQRGRQSSFQAEGADRDGGGGDEFRHLGGDSHEFADDEQGDDLSLFLRSVDKQQRRKLQQQQQQRLNNLNGAAAAAAPGQKSAKSSAGLADESSSAGTGAGKPRLSAARAVRRAMTLRSLVKNFSRRASSHEQPVNSSSGNPNSGNKAAGAPAKRERKSSGGSRAQVRADTAPAGVAANAAAAPRTRNRLLFGQARKLASSSQASSCKSSSAELMDGPMAQPALRQQASGSSAEQPMDKRAKRLDRMKSVMTAVSRRLEPLRVMRKAATASAADGLNQHQRHNATSTSMGNSPMKPMLVAAADNSLSASHNN